MIEKIIKLIEKYRDVIAYLFFGVCTTAVNIIAYWACAHILNAGTMPSAVTAWVIAVLFAYITNRKWVFRSTAVKPQEVIREMTGFFGCRLATGVVDWVIMFVFVEIMHLNDLVIKIAANVIVVVLNYIGSKFFVFRD